jgi:hypothetical protein
LCLNKLAERSIAGATIAETDLSGTTTKEYILFAGRQIALRNSAGTIYYYFGRVGHPSPKRHSRVPHPLRAVFAQRVGTDPRCRLQG